MLIIIKEIKTFFGQNYKNYINKWKICYSVCHKNVPSVYTLLIKTFYISITGSWGAVFRRHTVSGQNSGQSCIEKLLMIFDNDYSLCNS